MKIPKLGLYLYEEKDAIYNLTYDSHPEYMELIRVKKLKESHAYVSCRNRIDYFEKLIESGRLKKLSKLDQVLYNVYER